MLFIQILFDLHKNAFVSNKFFIIFMLNFFKNFLLQLRLLMPYFLLGMRKIYNVVYLDILLNYLDERKL